MSQLTTPEFRGSFVHLATTKKIERKDGSIKEVYAMTCALEKGHKETAPFLKKVQQLLKKAAVDKWGKVPKGCKFGLKDADKTEQGDKYPNLAGHYTFDMASQIKPRIVDKRGTPLDSADDLYSGAWYRVIITAWAWEHKEGGKGVSINLGNVLKVKDDEQFGNANSDPLEDFADFIDENAVDDDDDLLGGLGGDDDDDDLAGLFE